MASVKRIFLRRSGVFSAEAKAASNDPPGYTGPGGDGPVAETRSTTGPPSSDHGCEPCPDGRACNVDTAHRARSRVTPWCVGSVRVGAADAVAPVGTRRARTRKSCGHHRNAGEAPAAAFDSNLRARRQAFAQNRPTATSSYARIPRGLLLPSGTESAACTRSPDRALGSPPLTGRAGGRLNRAPEYGRGGGAAAGGGQLLLGGPEKAFAVTCSGDAVEVPVTEDLDQLALADRAGRRPGRRCRRSPPAGNRVASWPTLTTWNSTRKRFLKPLSFGSRMCSGSWPPSNPAGTFFRAPVPLVPRPAVLPLDASPRPTRVLAVFAPGAGRR